MDGVIESKTACCITGSKRARIVAGKDRKGNPLRTVICQDSGLVFTDPRPTPDEVAKFYSDDYRKAYKNTDTPKQKHIVRAGRLSITRINQLKQFIPANGSIFDVGAGGGEFVYLCGREGFSARGVEPNKGYGTFGIQQYGVDVELGFYQNANLQPESLDCVTMFHVLEHLEEPVDSMVQLAKFVKNDGFLYIEVPDVNDTNTAPNNKWHLAHLYNFNLRTLSAAGAKAGLKVVRRWSHGASISAVFQKTDTGFQDVESLLEGSFDETYNILKNHTSAMHYLRLHVPVGRLVHKIHKNMNEKRFAKAHKSPKQILDEIASMKQAG